jgi:hypothetical protein
MGASQVQIQQADQKQILTDSRSAGNAEFAIDKATIVRVNQVYRMYLDLLWAIECYRVRYQRILRFTSHLDFAIAISGAVAGGSGVGVLKDPRLAWMSGAAALLSVFLTAAKTAYHWPDKLRHVLDQMIQYEGVKDGFAQLVQDIEYKRAFPKAFEERFAKLRALEAKITIESNEILAEKEQFTVMDRIKRREGYEAWWLFTRRE